MTTSTLASLQKSGESIDRTRLALVATVTESGQRVMQAIANDPSNPEHDKAMERWKALAQLARDVESIEMQMREIYFKAEQLMLPANKVIPVLGHQVKLHASQKPKASRARKLIAPANTATPAL